MIPLSLSPSHENSCTKLYLSHSITPFSLSIITSLSLYPSPTHIMYLAIYLSLYLPFNTPLILSFYFCHSPSNTLILLLLALLFITPLFFLHPLSRSLSVFTLFLSMSILILSLFSPYSILFSSPSLTPFLNGKTLFNGFLAQVFFLLSSSSNFMGPINLSLLKHKSHEIDQTFCLEGFEPETSR